MKINIILATFALLILGCATPYRDLSTIIEKAQNGDANAQAELGFSYQYGDGVKQDAKEAYQWNLKAASQGNPMAQHNLAVMYDEGNDIPMNKAEAVKWYQEAVKKGNPRSQVNLGVMYWKGDGVQKDVKRGWDMLNSARMTSQDEQASWAARGALDEIKKELGVDSKIGRFSYPDWDVIQKAINE